MTPKEKALELWWKFYNRIEHTLSEEYSPHENFISRQLALIAIDEILNLNDIDLEYSFYLEVKQEIELL
jgi:hypothetical protein